MTYVCIAQCQHLFSISVSVLGVVVYWICGFAFAYGKNKYKDEDGKYHYTDANSFIGTVKSIINYVHSIKLRL